MYKLHLDEYFAKTSDRFSVYTSNPEDNDREHCHEFDELVMVDSGHGLHVLNGKLSYIQEGDVFYVRSGDFHFYDELGTLKLTNILINNTTEFKYLKNIGYILNQLQQHNSDQPGWLAPEQRQKVLSITHHLSKININNDNEELSRAHQEALFFQLIMSIIDSIQQVSKNHTKYRTYQLISWLQKNCLEEINWDDIESELLLTRRTIHRQIKDTTGMTPEGFLKRLRLVTARAKIRETDESITKISFDCGFTNSNHFSTCYKEAFGHTPTQDRLYCHIVINK
jgi:AraC family L-rhamnose operon regulatory protein RhaS